MAQRLPERQRTRYVRYQPGVGIAASSASTRSATPRPSGSRPPPRPRMMSSLGGVLAPCPPSTLGIEGQRLGYVSGTALVRALGVGMRCPHPNATTTTASTPPMLAPPSHSQPSAAAGRGTNVDAVAPTPTVSLTSAAGQIAVIGRGVLPERYRRQNRTGRPARMRRAGAGPD